jgi:Mg/Co/Ni transporter MgtE
MGAMSAAEALERMEVPSAVALACRIEAPVAAMLLRRVPLPARPNILFVCPEPWKTSIESALAAPRGSVGSLMDTRAGVFPEDWKISEVLAYLQARPSRLALDVFVARRDHKLVGRIDLRALEGRLSVRELRGAMAPDPPRLTAASAVRFVRDDALWRKFDTLPVVDEQGIFLGALSHRALRMLESEAGDRTEGRAGGAFVELAELAWTGYVAAVDVASSLTRSLTESSGKGGESRGAQDQG